MSFFQGVRIDHFERKFRVYTGAFCGKPHLDDGGKIILPASALDELARLNIVYPMLFKITNTNQGISTHCGVLEFSAEEGRVYIPFWMQEHLQLSPGMFVTITNANLPKGSFVKIRPQQKAFIEISDPRAVLEKKLRNFSCLTKGDTIMINYNDTNYLIDIMDIKPVTDSNGICIVETDVNVDFDRPLDMPPSPVNQGPPQEQIFDTIPRGVPQQQQQQQPVQEEPKFQAFKGEGRRLDGKQKKSAVSNVQPPTTTSTSTSNSSGALSGASPVPVVGRKRRKLGDTPTTSQQQQQPTAPSSSTTTTSEPKFVPFSGQGRTLK